MARFNIIDAETGAIKHSGYPTYNGIFLKVSFLEFREIASPTPIDWKVGDYVVWSGENRTGLTYKLYDIPQPTKKAGVGQCGDSFVYSQVQFYDATKELEICPFRDIVKDDNFVHFSTQNAVSTIEPLCSNVGGEWLNDGLLARLQANLDDMYIDETTYPGVSLPSWKVRMYDGLTQESNADVFNAVTSEFVFSVSGGSVLDALTAIYDTFGGVGWSFSVETISEDFNGVLYTNTRNVLTLGRPNVADSGNKTRVFSLGREGGITSIKKTQTNKNDIATKLYVYGSSRNINFQHYKSNPHILNAQSLDIRNLMIPVSKWGTTVKDGTVYSDARKAYLGSSEGQSTYGVIPKFHYFDGSDGEEIYPTISEITAGELRHYKQVSGNTSYVPSSSIYADSDRVDMIKSAEIPQDDGLYTSGGSYTSQKQITSGSVSKSATEVTQYSHISPSDMVVFDSFTALSDGKCVIKDLGAGITFIDNGLLGGDVSLLRFAPAYSINNDMYVPYGFSHSVQPTAFGEQIWYRMGNDYHLEYEEGDIVRFGFVLFSSTGETIVGWDSESLDINVEFEGTAYGLSYDRTEQYSRYFHLTLKQIGFDINERQALCENGIGTIFMNNGTRTNGKNTCTGRSFAIKSCVYQSETDDWRLECIRNYDSSTGTAYPNNQYTIESGDVFVLLDIAMDDLYIGIAEQRLYDAGMRLLEKKSRVQPFWSPELSSILIKNQSVTLLEGMYFGINDAQLTDGVDSYVLIDTIKVSEGESNIPVYSVGLREEKSQSFSNSAKSVSQSSVSLLTEPTTADRTEQKAYVTEILTCNSLASESEKSIDAYETTIVANSIIRARFTLGNSASEPTLRVGYSKFYPIKVLFNGQKKSIKTIQSDMVLELYFDGVDWVVIGNPLVVSGYVSSNNSEQTYEIYANGRMRIFGISYTISSNITISFAVPFKDSYYAVSAESTTGADAYYNSGQITIWGRSASSFVVGWYENRETEVTYIVEGYAW